MKIGELGPFELDLTWYEDSPGDAWWKTKDLEVCNEVLSSWFDLDPYGQLFLVMHDRPAKNRVRISNLRYDENAYFGRGAWFISMQDKHRKNHIVEVCDREAEILRQLPEVFYLEAQQWDT